MRENLISLVAQKITQVGYHNHVQLSLKRLFAENNLNSCEPPNLWTFLSTEYGAGTSTVTQSLAAILNTRGQTVDVLNYGLLLPAPVHWQSSFDNTPAHARFISASLDTQLRQSLNAIISKTEFINPKTSFSNPKRIFLDVGPSFSAQAVDLFLISDMPIIVTQANKQSLHKLDHLLRFIFMRILDVYLPASIKEEYIDKVRNRMFTHYDYASMLEKLADISKNRQEKLVNFLSHFSPRIIISKNKSSCNALDILPQLSNHFLFYNLAVLGVVDVKKQQQRTRTFISKPVDEPARDANIELLEEKMQTWLHTHF